MISLKIQAVNGFKDILPDEVGCWQQLEQQARDIFQRFGGREIRLPLLERTELFARSIGESTDIVEKEMYTFPDQGITLRPEGTASLLRAFIEHAMHLQQPVQRLYTIGPMFRHERPQKGRQRQFHQMDFEIIGAAEPEVDAELMSMGHLLLAELGLNVRLEINSLGCSACRPIFRQALVAYLEDHQGGLCPDCRRRTRTNPLRVLDCKQQQCRNLVLDAPSILDHLCASCQEHFHRVQYQLDQLAVPHTLNRFMVRGLDYYTRTTFEFTTTRLGAQAAVGAGGRYDGLIHSLGGPDLPGIGFAMGMERLVLLLQENQQDCGSQGQTDLFVATLGENGGQLGFLLTNTLRQRGMRVAMDYSGRSLKAQMKQAGRCRARYTLILGDNELAKGEAVLRDMQHREQTDFSLQDDIATQADRLIARITHKES